MDKLAVKDIVDQKTVYEKHNSFENFHSKKTASEAEALRRIAAQAQHFSERNNGYFREIVCRAAHDVLHRKEDPESFKLYPPTLSELSKVSDANLPRYLFYRYRYEIFPAEKKLDEFPPCLQVEVTSVCNYRCVFCYQTDPELTSKQNGHMGMMPLALFKKIIDEAEGKCEAITIASRGEPLVSRELVSMLRYMNGKFLATKLNTNASLLTEEKCHGILQTDLQTLVFSCDAAEEPLYSQLRVHGHLETVLKNIRMFREIKERDYPESGMTTRVSGVKVNHLQNMDQMEKFWGDLVDEIAFVKYNPWENTYARPINDETRPCTDLWRRCFVWWDGRMNPCDVDYRSELSIGNVAESSISQLWASEKYNALRKKHLEGRRLEASPCNRCTQI